MIKSMLFSSYFIKNTITNCILYCFLFLLQPNAAWCSPKITLHAVLIADTNSNISATVKNDLHRMKKTLRLITEKTNLRLKIKTLTGRNVESMKVKNLVIALTKTRGISLFYFSGHGYRKQLSHSPWPYLVFSTYMESIAGDTLYQNLKKSKSRLTLLLLDCCNQFLEVKFPTFILKNNSPAPLSSIRLKDLFLKTKGFIAMAASKPGEFARGTSNGSYFTTSLLESITESTSHATWEEVLKETQQKCYLLDQHPIGEISTQHVGNPPGKS